MIKINYPYAKIDTQSTTLLFKAEKWKNALYAYHKDVEYHDVAIQYYGARISDYDNYDIYGINPLKCRQSGRRAGRLYEGAYAVFDRRHGQQPRKFNSSRQR